MPSEPVAQTTEVERIARLLAASEMGLVRDPKGERLPFELWSQRIRIAQAIVREGRQGDLEE